VTGPAWITATLIDISVGGAALETEAMLQPGDAVIASFSLGDTQFSNLKSVVLDSRPGPTGAQRVRVEFEGLPTSDEERLSAAVAYLSVKPAAALPAP
jgi:c-di-GMP-binding flagellar brake protein YcgR